MANVSLPGIVQCIRETVEAHRDVCRSDRELLRGFVEEKDQTAFGELLRRHGAMVLGVCRRVLGSSHDADDAFQATFLVLARKAETIRNENTLANWLYGVSYRVAMKAKRDAARRRKHELNTTETRSPESPDWETGWLELQAVLDEEVQRLAPTYREAFVLCCLEGLTKTEAAEQIGIKEGTLSSRLARARQRLQTQLSRRGIHLSAVLSALALSSSSKANVSLRVLELLTTAATQYGSGSKITVSGFSSSALELAEGAIQTMVSTKTKLVLALVFTLGMLGFGASLLAKPGYPTSEPIAPVQPSQEPKAAPATPKPAADEKSTGSVIFAGKVVGPDAKPVTKATVEVWANRKRIARTTTPEDGTFRLTVEKDAVKQPFRLVAHGDGLGVDWVNLGANSKKGVTLHLPADDLPIEGRVLDLEGQPVPGATVAVNRVASLPRTTDREDWLKRYKASSRAREEFRGTGSKMIGRYKTTKADSKGGFRLSGFGRGRLVNLEIRGPQVESTLVRVFVHPGPRRGWTPGRWGLYPAKFDVVLAPSKPILGTVRDARTKKPLAGIRVMAGPSNQRWVKTDKDGNYRIDGIPKSDQYWLSAGGEIGNPYFDRTRHRIADTSGVEPLRLDVELERGVEIRGKLIDKTTGKPIKGRVGWHGRVDNPNLANFVSLSGARMIISDYGRVQSDGTFTVLAVPGPGYVSARADVIDDYLQRLPEDLNLGNLIVEFNHTYVPVDPDPAKPESKTCSIALEPGKKVTGKLVDPEGKPVTGWYSAGLHPVVMSIGIALPNNRTTFTLGGLDRPRKVVFFEPKQKLAKVLTVSRKSEQPMTVRLERPSAVIRGRVVTGEKNTPRANLKVVAVPSRQYELYGKELPLELLVDSRTWEPMLKVESITDEQGGFALKGLVPGLRYWVYWESYGRLYGSDTRAVAVEAGKPVDLGMLNTKPTTDTGGNDTP